MVELNMGVRQKAPAATDRRPLAPTNLQLSPNRSPNPDHNAFRVLYTAAVVPTGGDAVGGYNLYLDGVFKRAVSGANLEPVYGTSEGIAPETPYSVEVSAYNSYGEGPKSAVLNVTTIAAPVGPAAPTGLVHTSKGVNNVNLSWTASTTTSPAVVYDVYVQDNDLALATGLTGTTFNATGLTENTSYSFVVYARNSDGTSGPSNVYTVSTDAVTTGGAVMRTDDAWSFYGFNVKATYGTGTHGATSTNQQKVRDLAVDVGCRIYRQEVAESGAVATRQMAFVKAIYDNCGGQFHATLGNMRNKNGHNVPAMTAAQLRTHAATAIKSSLDRLKAMNDDTTLNSGGPIENWLHSIAGPNEIEEVSETGSNWARNARIWQEAIWRGARQGRFWDDTTASWTVQRSGFPTLFANIKIYAGSTRSDVDKDATTQQVPITYAGDFINGTSGDRILTQWTDGGNCHLYHAGRSAHWRVQTYIDLHLPTIKATLHNVRPNPPFVFTESGYNSMGYGYDGADVEPIAFGNISGVDGSIKVPPWVMATYDCRAVAQFAKWQIPYMRFELVNDAYLNADGTRMAWEIQSWFGMVDTPHVDPNHATRPWVPMPAYYALRRLYNLMKDRGSTPKVKPTFSTSPLAHTITAANGCESLVTQKSDGSHWVFLWRNIDFFKDNIDGTAGRVCYGPSGSLVNGLPPAVNWTARLDHASGNKTVELWQPNKALWANRSITNPTLAQAQDTRSVGHSTSASWTTIPAAESSWTVAAGGSFTVPVDINLLVLKIA